MIITNITNTITNIAISTYNITTFTTNIIFTTMYITIVYDSTMAKYLFQFSKRKLLLMYKKCIWSKRITHHLNIYNLPFNIKKKKCLIQLDFGSQHCAIP